MGTRIAIMAGGTGGHVFPALAVAEQLRQQGAEVFWIGTRAGMESRLVPEHGIDMEWVSIEGVRGKGLAQVLKAPAKLLAALSQARGIFRRRRPDLVLGMGGFVSGPGGLAARTLGLPLVIHEQNFVPGMTNQWLARMATRVFEAFPGSFPAARCAVVSGNPVRQAIAALPAPAERFAARAAPARLLVLGGSLGAKVLNEMLPPAIAALSATQRPQIRHQAGERTLEVAKAAYAAAGVDAEVMPFIRDMAEAYAWADLVVCRAGALTVSELAAAGVGSVLVPYPFAVDDHQVGNARYLTDVDAARLVIQRDLTLEGLRALLAELLEDRSRLVTMAEAARSRAQPEATARIAAACLELAKGSGARAKESLQEVQDS
ncbi:undecaprenyldiphospho-muramoylpentapeptide beta-N-acetylglucosaminyltransferase [Thiorhodococcus mannitoliphagus]|uniref:UDP-N-acetylglucosamine--N-acetylmuramyl-(pentapeptide) pyrophosphoryl-undecaprenol N-acetylglucosamine transferase n=1 Tax=Thiorhodococcus mannitoliphagus TaxID=329406 RepID=A0A6P1DS93_9GAMM|nr:undecaprenyldiphospho-muramoylpentapeptide beta-N-acetylglucosaminyltransferase [Thiorhodococcus mannitoliphagus]NEX18872.1 undecaprenyldiphospho-muramoylpentapeptide beta-N-acetylglucosaminyltransferase [Thiorhodococcus mannitoliphagus]